MCAFSRFYTSTCTELIVLPHEAVLRCLGCKTIRTGANSAADATNVTIGPYAAFPLPRDTTQAVPGSNTWLVLMLVSPIRRKQHVFTTSGTMQYCVEAFRLKLYMNSSSPSCFLHARNRHPLWKLVTNNLMLSFRT